MNQVTFSAAKAVFFPIPPAEPVAVSQYGFYYALDLTSPEGGKTEMADGSVEFRDVSFRYSKEANRNSLEKIDLQVMQQYSMYITSDVDVVIQYGRMDINQDNLAYMVTLGYGE